MEPDLETLVGRALSLCSRASGRRVVLGITGAPGAGKSTLAAQLIDMLRTVGGPQATCLPMDGFHLADVTLDRLGRRDRKGAPDTFDASGYVVMLQRIRSEAGDVIYAPGFERDLEQPIAAAISIGHDIGLVVTEGNYLLLDDGPWAGVAALLDECWYVEVDPSERVTQLVGRHIRFGKSPDDAASWVADVDEPNARLVETTRGSASLVVRR